MKQFHAISRRFLQAAFIAAVSLVFSVPAGARKLDIDTRPYELPVFPGSLGNGITRFVSHNFRYPMEAWQQQRLSALSIHALVRVNGKIETFEITTPVELHPALYDEVRRVIEKMEWYPAINRNGRKVNAYVDFHFPLVRETTDFSTPIPYGMEKYARSAAKLARKLNRLGAMDKPVDMQKVVTEIGGAAELFPTIPEFQSANSRLLASANLGSIAVETADSALVWYHVANTKEFEKTSDDPFSLVNETETEYGTNFSGRAELWLATIRAALHAVYPSAASETAFTDALALADLRSADGRLRPWNDLKERQIIEKRVERLKRDLVSEWSNGSIRLDENTAGWMKVANNMSVDELADYATYWSDRGSIKPGAQVIQLASQIQREKKKLWNLQQSTPKELQSILGLKALITWFRSGDAGFHSFIADMLASGNLSDDETVYLRQLENTFDSHSATLADRYASIQSISCLVPPASFTSDERKAFYARRDALEEIFPLKWLAGE